MHETIKNVHEAWPLGKVHFWNIFISFLPCTLVTAYTYKTYNYPKNILKTLTDTWTYQFLTYSTFNKNTNYSRDVSIRDEHLSLKCKTDILEEFSICNGNRKEQRMFKSWKDFWPITPNSIPSDQTRPSYSQASQGTWTNQRPDLN